jgi:hypothetical protein
MRSYRSVHGASRLANGSHSGSVHGGGNLALQADGSSRSGAMFMSAAALDGGADVGYGPKPPGFVLPGQGGPLQDNAGVGLHCSTCPSTHAAGTLHIDPWNASGLQHKLCLQCEAVQQQSSSGEAWSAWSTPELRLVPG